MPYKQQNQMKEIYKGIKEKCIDNKYPKGAFTKLPEGHDYKKTMNGGIA